MPSFNTSKSFVTSPEMILKQPLSQKTDIWRLAAIAYLLATGKDESSLSDKDHTLSGEEIRQISSTEGSVRDRESLVYEMLCRKQFEFDNQNVSDRFREFIEACVRENSSIDELMELPIMTEAAEKQKAW